MTDLFGETASDPMPSVTLLHGRFSGLWTLRQLTDMLPLRQRIANMYGKTMPVPRLECWFGPRPYEFGGRVEEPQPWLPIMVDIRYAVEAATGERFDSCFVNYYRDQNDTIPWHADDDSWIREPIASVTFGGTRRFVMRRKGTGKRNVLSWWLGDGDLFVMHEGTQAAWEHAVPRDTEPRKPRINLTFRGTK